MGLKNYKCRGYTTTQDCGSDDVSVDISACKVETWQRIKAILDDDEKPGFRETITLSFRTEGTDEVRRQVREIEDALDRIIYKQKLVND